MLSRTNLSRSKHTVYLLIGSYNTWAWGHALINNTVGTKIQDDISAGHAVINSRIVINIKVT